jgi:hypothetical protein
VHTSYSKEGAFDVGIKLTDNDGFSTSAILKVTVKEQEQYVPLVLGASLAIILCLLITILAIMFARRKPEMLPVHRLTGEVTAPSQREAQRQAPRPEKRQGVGKESNSSMLLFLQFH